MSGSCFLFGHKDAPDSILCSIECAVEQAIARNITTFYVGYHGNFDHLAAAALRNVKQHHNKITLILLLAYHPSEVPISIPFDFDETFYPPLENVPRRYALIRANQYMIKRVDHIICYVNHIGNTRQLLNLAMNRQKTAALTIMNLADQPL